MFASLETIALSCPCNAFSRACQYDLPVIFVVQNNSELGWIRCGHGDRPIASEFIETDHAKMAQAFGCQGIHIERSHDLRCPRLRR